MMMHAAAQAGVIQRGPKGIILPARNAFDFVDKPRANALDLEMSANRGNNNVSGIHSKGHEKIKKVMNNIKRLSRSVLGNQKQLTVKNSF